MTTWIERSVLVLLCIAVATTALRLDRQNRDLRTTISELGARQIGEAALRPGDVVRNIRGSDAEGRMTSIDTASGDVLLITFSAGCPTTRRNVAEWTHAIETARTRGLRIVWVSRDAISTASEFAMTRGLRDAMLADVPYDIYARLGLAAVPQTIVLKGGVVSASWQGSINRDVIVAALLH